MFESIIFRNQRKFNVNEPIDIEALYEALLFYGSVTVIADKSILKQLIGIFGHDGLLELVQDEFLHIEYLNNNTGIHTQNSGSSNELHSPVTFNSPVLDLDNVAFELFRESTGKQGKGRRLATRFIKNVSEVDFEIDITKQLISDLAEASYVEDAVRRILSFYTPEYGNMFDIKFHVTKEGDGLSVDTNLDFSRLNWIYHTRVSIKHSSITPAYLLIHLFNTRCDIHFASTHTSEIATDPISSAIMDIKYSELLKNRGASINTLTSFKRFVSVDTKNIGVVLACGRRSHKEYLVLLNKSRKMRNWLHNKEPDIDLIKDYHEAVVSDTWADKLPTKTTRWSIFSGIGLVLDTAGAGGLGTFAGLGISAVDTFLLDRLIKGWKPNQFISDLKEFTKDVEG